MKFIYLEEEDSQHTLDIGLRPSNPIYKDTGIYQVQGSTQVRLDDATRHEDKDAIQQNILTAIKRMPSSYIVITGVSPGWVKSDAIAIALQWVSLVFVYDGKNYSVITPPTPQARQIHDTIISVMS